MDQDALILLVAAIATLAGAFFTVVPLLPGTLFLPLGAVVCALIVDWDLFPWWFWVAQAVLVGGYLLVDNLVQLLGVRRAGGSRSAMVGGAVGVFVGPLALAPLMGPLALLLGPPIGAVAGTLIGEERARRRRSSSEQAAPGRAYGKLGIAALIAFAVGTAIKLTIIAAQVALLLTDAR